MYVPLDERYRRSKIQDGAIMTVKWRSIGRRAFGVVASLLLLALIEEGRVLRNFLGAKAALAVAILVLVLFLAAIRMFQQEYKERRTLRRQGDPTATSKSKVILLIIGGGCTLWALLSVFVGPDFTIRSWPISYEPSDDFAIGSLLAGVCLIWYALKSRSSSGPSEQRHES